VEQNARDPSTVRVIRNNSQRSSRGAGVLEEVRRPNLHSWRSGNVQYIGHLGNVFL
jgi:hypothetical protein